MRVGILTVSDRSHRGEREDRSGPALAQALREFWAAEARAAGDERVPEDHTTMAAIVV